MPSSDSQTMEVEPESSDPLDEFFKNVKAGKIATEPAKETLGLIESHHREDFEKVFKREFGNGEEESKEFVESGVRTKKEIIAAIAALEEAFAVFNQTVQFDKDYELALVGESDWMVLSDIKEDSDTIMLGDLKADLEMDLAETDKYLRWLNKQKKPISPETILLGHVSFFLIKHGYSPVHTLEITRLLINNMGEGDPKSEKLRKANRKLLDRYGAPRKHKPRAKH